MIKPKSVFRILFYILLQTLVYILIYELAPAAIKLVIILVGTILFLLFVYRLYKGGIINEKRVENYRFNAVAVLVTFLAMNAFLYWHTKGNLDSFVMFNLTMSLIYNPYVKLNVPS